MIAGAASSLGTNVDTSTPMALKQNAPTTIVTTNPR